MELKHKDITDKIIKAFYDVYNELGFGFLESIYASALYIVLSDFGPKPKFKRFAFDNSRKKIRGNLRESAAG